MDIRREGELRKGIISVAHMTSPHALPKSFPVSFTFSRFLPTTWLISEEMTHISLNSQNTLIKDIPSTRTVLVFVGKITATQASQLPYLIIDMTDQWVTCRTTTELTFCLKFLCCTNYNSLQGFV